LPQMQIRILDLGLYYIYVWFFLLVLIRI